jgi:isoleucyl-tRNA synthetase
VGSRAVIVAEALRPRSQRAGGRDLRSAGPARFKGEQMERTPLHAPALRPAVRSGVLGDYVTLEAGTGAVPPAPGPRLGRLQHRRPLRLDIYAPVGPGGHFLDTVDMFAGQRVFDANPHVEQALKEPGPASGTARISRTSIRTAGAATTR